MAINTIQLAKVKQLSSSDNIKVIDITVKNSKHFLAPIWEIVMGVKNNVISEDEYTTIYLDILRKRYKENQQQFLNLIQETNEKNIAITCFCNKDSFCHRFIAIDVLKKIADKHNIEFNYIGELTPITKKNKP